MDCGVELEEAGPPAHPEKLSRLAEAIESPVPEQLERFLLRHDGAFPEANEYDGAETESEVQEFYSVEGMIEAVTDTFAGRIPPYMLPFAYTGWGDQLCISLREEDAGAIYQWDHEEETEPPDDSNLALLARSFDEFVGRLRPLEDDDASVAEIEVADPTDPAGWPLDDAEFEATLKLDARARYAYFMRRVVEHGALWILSRDDVMAYAGEHSELVPVWPHPRYAEAAETGGWKGYAPEPILVALWADEWAPGFEEQGKEVLVFPDADAGGVVVSLEEFQDELDETAFAG